MVTLLSNWWEAISPVHQIGVVAILFLVVVGVIFRIRQKILKAKIEYFLFNNQYHSINPKNNAVVFPKVSFKTNQIVLKNCLKKTIEQIRQDKEIWERTFSKELRGRRIGDIRLEGANIRLALV